MQINVGSAVVSATRYELAWCLPRPDAAGTRESVGWWLQSAYANAQSAGARLKEIQDTICAQRGSAAIYEVNYDGGGRLVSERVIARCGNERPPLRSNIRQPNAQLQAAFAQLVGGTSGTQRKGKPVWARVAMPLTAMAGIAAAVYVAVVFAGPYSWQGSVTREPAPRTVDADARRKNEAQILVPRVNSQICDRYLFDNGGGGMRPVEAIPCDQRKAPSSLTEQTNSFTAGWTGRDSAK